MKNNTSLTIKDLSMRIEDFCPIRIYVNGELVWDDDSNTLEEYKKLLNREELVISIHFDIVFFHHSIVYIKTIY